MWAISPTEVNHKHIPVTFPKRFGQVFFPKTFSDVERHRSFLPCWGETPVVLCTSQSPSLAVRENQRVPFIPFSQTGLLSQYVNPGLSKGLLQITVCGTIYTEVAPVTCDVGSHLTNRHSTHNTTQKYCILVPVLWLLLRYSQHFLHMFQIKSLAGEVGIMPFEQLEGFLYATSVQEVFEFTSVGFLRLLKWLKLISIEKTKWEQQSGNYDMTVVLIECEMCVLWKCTLY